MELKEQNILFFTRTMKLGGTENVVLQLCEIFRPLVNKIVVCSCGGVNVEKLTALGIEHYEIPDIEIKTAQVVVKTAAALHTIIKNERITIIHTHHRMASFYVAALKLNKKCTFINTSHNTFTDKKKLTKFALKKGSLVACGEMVKLNLIEEFEIQAKQVTVIHNAVQPFDGKIIVDDVIKKLHTDGYFIVGNVGRLSEQKGMEYYIQAIPEILKNHTKIHFLIIGEGEDERKLKKLVCSLNIGEYVTFMGYRSDIQNIMAQINLIVLSSLWEGLPLTPIEAFSVGRTIVATAVDGTVEIVKDGQNGCLVNARDSKALSKKIDFLINNDKIRLEYESNALKTFRKNFSIDYFAQQYVDYYQQQ